MSLKELIKSVEKIYPYKSIEDLEIDEDYTNKYYQNSNLGYKFIHSNKGSVHMALSNGDEFKEEDYYTHLKIIQERIAKIQFKKSLNILELGCGKGFNINYLAQKNSNHNFIGIDITREHLNQASEINEQNENVVIKYMSFDDFKFKNIKFDLIYEIESICHTSNYKILIGNIYNLLETNGLFISFEGYRNTLNKNKTVEIEKLQNYIEKSMSVKHGIEVEDWIKCAENIFSKVIAINRSEQIIPNLRKFNNLAGKYFRRPKLAKLVNLIMPKELVMNSIAGYLMLYSVENEYHVYYQIEATK